MKAFHYFAVPVLLFIFILGVSASGSSLPAAEILRKLDDHFRISDDFEVTIRVESYTNNEFNGLTVMQGYARAGQMAMITFLEPSNMKDRKVLVKENEMWLMIPKVKNPIRITASQKLVGGISYGDFARASYAEEYDLTGSGAKELVAGLNANGTKSDSKTNCLVVGLAAKNKRNNYHKIVFWVDEQNFLPIQADFFALSGKKMLTAYYAAFKEWNGRMIVTKMFLFDQINTAKHYSIEYVDIQ
jgi:outer membrane lipoprotein-sorting protein